MRKLIFQICLLFLVGYCYAGFGTGGIVTITTDPDCRVSTGVIASGLTTLVEQVKSSNTINEAAINTKVSYTVFYGSMTNIETQKNTIAGSVFTINTASSPATVTSPCSIGNIRWGMDVASGDWYIYLSTATNFWSRVKLNAW